MTDVIELKPCVSDIIDKFDLLDIVQDRPVTSSLLVAEKFGKEHYNVLKSLTLILTSANKDKASQHFFKSEYVDSTGRHNRMYYMDRDGFCFLVMGFTGEKADKWKWDFIDSFNAMEAELKRYHDIELGRLLERQKSKYVRRTLTDTIKDCVPETPNKRFMYKNYTDLIYKMLYGMNCKKLKESLGLDKKASLRDYMSEDEIKRVEQTENLISSLIASNYTYTEIKDILSKKYLDTDN